MVYGGRSKGYEGSEYKLWRYDERGSFRNKVEALEGKTIAK